MKHSLKELLVMVISTIVDLQGFVVNKKFIVKEVVVLKQRVVFTHYVLTSPMKIFDKIRQVFLTGLSG